MQREEKQCNIYNSNEQNGLGANKPEKFKTEKRGLRKQ